MHFDYIIIGAGLPSLFLSKYITTTMKKSVAVIDSAANVGGLYYPLEYNKLYYDDAMHVIYTTGVREIDEIIENFAFKYDWIKLSNFSKDLAGSSYNSSINEFSPYIDLRNSLSSELINTIKAEISQRNYISSPFVQGSVSEGIYFHFGKSLGDIVHSIISEKFGVNFMSSASDALRFNDLRRVLVENYTAESYLELSEPERAVFGFPEQLKLPLKLINNQVGFYPNDFTWKSSLENIKKDLIESGVSFILKSEIRSIKQNGSCFHIDIKHDAEMKRISTGFAVSTIGTGIARYFNDLDTGINNERPISSNRTIVKYYKVNNPDNKFNKYKNYYYFDYNKNITTYRVTFYRNYSSWLDKMNINILSQEIWNNSDIQDSIKIDDNLTEDLIRMGFDIDPELLEPIFSTNKIRPMFPEYNILNESIDKLRQIEKLHGNIACAGVMSSRDSLLLPGVIRKLFAYFI